MDKVSAGIDLGTTNSCLAVLQGGQPAVVPNDLGDAVTPSLVSVLADGVLVGKKARSRLLTHPVNTFASIKRRMGERYSRTVLGKEYTPESVSALVLSHVKQTAEARLGSTIEDAVVTVPANFNSIQRQATKDAGEIAGLNVLRVLNEPTAAALAYGRRHRLSSVLVVFDLGGGTFDISVVEAEDGLYEVLYSIGDNHLGGDDFNLRIVQWIVEGFGKHTGLDVRRDTAAMCLVQEWAVAAKHALTGAPEVRIRIENLYGGKSFDSVLTRAAFEEMCKDLFNRLRALAWKVGEEMRKPNYRDAHPGAFDGRMDGCDLLLVGGETRVPAVRALATSLFRGSGGECMPTSIPTMRWPSALPCRRGLFTRSKRCGTSCWSTRPHCRSAPKSRAGCFRGSSTQIRAYRAHEPASTSPSMTSNRPSSSASTKARANWPRSTSSSVNSNSCSTLPVRAPTPSCT
jgi:molecular chaperone DnaK